MKNRRYLALALAVLLVFTMLTGCAAKSQSAETTTAYDTAYPEEAYDYEYAEEEYAAEAPAEMMSTTNYELEAAAEPSVDADSAAADYASKIIYTANLSIQTTEFDDAVASLEQMVTSFGGFIESSNISGNTWYEEDGSVSIIDRWGSYTVRVPATRFEEFLRQSGSLGNVISTSRDAQNVTSQYTDYEARLDSLNTEEARLLELLAQSEDIDSLIALEERLSEVRYETESIERNLRNLDQQISYSTVNLELQEVEKYTPVASVQRTFGEKLRDSISNGWTRFVTGLGDFVISLVGALPALLLFAVIVLVIVLVIRRAIRKRRARKAAKAAAQQEAKPQE